MQNNIIKRIALYGGSFDPPHKGHLSLIKNLTTLQIITEVWLLPCGDRTDKKLLLTKDQRFQLLNKLASTIIKNKSDPVQKNENVGIKISDQQILLSKKMNRMIPTIQLLDYFKQKYKQYQFHFVIGADLLETIHTWQSYERLLKQYSFIIYPRQGYQFAVQKLKQHQSNDIAKKQLSKIDKNCSKQQIILRNIPKHYYFSEFYPIKISSSFIKSTILSQQISKQQKRQKISDFLDDITLETLTKKSYI